MKHLYKGVDKYHGTCRPMGGDESKFIDGCHNQLYWLRTLRCKTIQGHFYERRVISIGCIFNGCGYVLCDIPYSFWNEVDQ